MMSIAHCSYFVHQWNSSNESNINNTVTHLNSTLLNLGETVALLLAVTCACDALRTLSVPLKDSREAHRKSEQIIELHREMARRQERGTQQWREDRREAHRDDEKTRERHMAMRRRSEMAIKWGTMMKPQTQYAVILGSWQYWGLQWLQYCHALEMALFLPHESTNQTKTIR